MSAKDPDRKVFKRWIEEPVLWEDASGKAHLNVPNLLRQIGLEVTEENVAMVMEMAPAVIARLRPDASAVLRYSPED